MNKSVINKLFKFKKYNSITSNKQLSIKKSIATVDEGSKTVAIPKNPWTAISDPKGSGLIYYWNTETNETTPLGSPKPSHWIEVKGNDERSLSYWWNPETNQTTALGAPKPPSYPTIQSYPGIFNQQQPPQSLGGSMVTYALIGASMTLGMIVVRLIIG